DVAVRVLALGRLLRADERDAQRLDRVPRLGEHAARDVLAAAAADEVGRELRDGPAEDRREDPGERLGALAEETTVLVALPVRHESLVDEAGVPGHRRGHDLAVGVEDVAALRHELTRDEPAPKRLGGEVGPLDGLDVDETPGEDPEDREDPDEERTL